MRGEPSQNSQVRRYWKFHWNSLAALPPVGKVDYQPKGGAFRMYSEGQFSGECSEYFPIEKQNRKLSPLGYCVYCGDQAWLRSAEQPLTSEHIIPEFLCAGLEIQEASCFTCQKITSKIESTLARELFDPVRASLQLKGKKGVLHKRRFRIDTGAQSTSTTVLAVDDYPSMIVLPFLYPASIYSSRPERFDEFFNLRLYNISANQSVLSSLNIDKFSSLHIDIVYFSQFLSKIALSFASSYWRDGAFSSIIREFIRKDYSVIEPDFTHLTRVGCLWQTKERQSQVLHEVEAGMMHWNGQASRTVRVRLFAKFGMPSYYVTVG